MIICEETIKITDWITTVVSALGLGTTLYVLWDTRKDADKIQSQVNSLAKLALTYQKSHRDEIMPKLVFTQFVRFKEYSEVTITNTESPALSVKIISANIGGIPLKIKENVTIEIIPTKREGKFELEKLPSEASKLYYDNRPVIIEIEFRNKENEAFSQKLERNDVSYFVSHIPVLKK